MKKTAGYFIFVLNFFLFFCLSGFTMSASAADIPTQDFSRKCGENVSWNYDAETETVTISGKGNMYEDYSWVKDIADKYSGNKKSVKNVVVGDGVTSISKLMFCAFESLETVTMGKDVAEIGYGAFSDCSKLKTVVLAKNLKTIGECAFVNCASLTSIDFPSGLEHIGNVAFESCGLKGELILPNTVVEIGYRAFQYCMFLEKIVVPESVKEIKGYTFVTHATVVIMNRSCVIADNEMTIYSRVSGYVGSSAYEYAMKYNKSFIPLIEHEHKYTAKVTKKATCTKKGVKTYTCSCGDTYTKATAKADHKYERAVTKATTSKDGKIIKTCKVCGYKKTSTITKISNIKLSTVKYVYNGKEKKPFVTVKDSKGNTIKNTYYTVTYSGKRIAVGTYNIKITFKGNYSGSKTLKFQIVLGQVTGIKAVRNGKGVDLTWNKVKGATGYILEEYDSKSGKFIEMKKCSANILKKSEFNNITIIVRIRAYYIRDGKTYYGDYSAAKKITI